MKQEHLPTGKRYHVSDNGCGKKTVVMRKTQAYCTTCDLVIHPSHIRDAVSERRPTK